MPLFRHTGLLILVLLLGSFSPAAGQKVAARPNIVVILSDDHGWSDLGCQGALKDVRTPNLDRLAAEGVRCTAGYVTAPQCSPSRAGLLTGRHQQRFGLEDNRQCPLPLEEVTLAERLKAAGYVTGMVGKWHLDPNPLSSAWIAKHLPNPMLSADGRPVIPEEMRLAYGPAAQGFTETFAGELRRYRATYDLQGKDLDPKGEWVTDPRLRLDVQTDAALAFLRRHRRDPFFLYLAYYGPHVPLEATPEYLARFPGPMPERRRHALAMLAAIDDGVGRIAAQLRADGLDDRTLIVFAGDNGAPLNLDMKDLPIAGPDNGWDGSRNDPWVGEKGMLAEGGIRVPFLMRWTGTLPAGRVYERPVSTLDVAPTALAAAGVPRASGLDGVDVLPYLTGKQSGDPHEALFWRFQNQAAVRAGRWKYLRAGSAGEYLFDLESEAHEKKNLLSAQPEKARELAVKLETWARGLQTPGVPSGRLNAGEARWYGFFFKGD